jgi:hypothetical protein
MTGALLFIKIEKVNYSLDLQKTNSNMPNERRKKKQTSLLTFENFRWIDFLMKSPKSPPFPKASFSKEPRMTRAKERPPSKRSSPATKNRQEN